jgi:integrase
MRFTDRSIAGLKAKTERYEAWEDGRTGLGVRVSPKGRKTWVFMYRYAGKARRMTLGTYPAIGLAKAHVRHSRAKESLEEGIDPGAKQIEHKRAERSAETVSDLIDEYLEKWARPRKRSADEDERSLRKEVEPAWGRRKAKDITRRDVITLLDGIVERGSPIQANRTLAVIRKMFNFAIGRDIVDATPVAMVKAPAKENQRDRILSADEIRTFWNGVDKASMNTGIKLSLKLQLATAQRKGEIVGAEVSEFDLEESVWTIPAERSKNGLAHRVPLSDLAINIIKQAMADADGSEYVFPGRREGSSLTAAAVNHALRLALQPTKKNGEARPPAIPLENVTPHDLRRTAASGMTSIGVSRLVVSKILNHVESGITAVYDRHSYDQEKRHALDAWAAHLEGIVSGKAKAGNVVALAKVVETA